MDGNGGPRETGAIGATGAAGGNGASGANGLAYRSHVISWNLTRKCNEHCEHCYIHAGPLARLNDELSTAECLRVVDQLAEVNPGALVILTGGEPLLRPDVFEISRYATDAGFMVVMGTNGVLIRPHVAERMIDAGIQGVAISIDSLRPELHDAFRGYTGAWANSVQGMRVLDELGLPFLIQTTVIEENYHELPELVAWAHARGALVFNLYFLVPTGRGAFMSTITPAHYEALMRDLVELGAAYRGKMLINAKCAPHYQRVLWEHDPEHPLLKTFVGAGACPAGMQYVGIRPNGDVTPCPYLPVYGGNLREQSFAAIWTDSEVFKRIRRRGELGGKCGPCEFSQLCSGCRARAYGLTGDFMAEDPWCVYEPGAYGGGTIAPPRETYGLGGDFALHWTPEAAARAKLIPGFVRGKVVAGVESWAREHGHATITPEIMHRAREERLGGRVAGVPEFVRRMIARPSAETVPADTPASGGTAHADP